MNGAIDKDANLDTKFPFERTWTLGKGLRPSGVSLTALELLVLKPNANCDGTPPKNMIGRSSRAILQA
jgi:hypothetical protein